MEPPAGFGNPRQDPGPLEVFVGQRLPVEEAEDEDPVVGQEVDDRRTHAGGRGADAVLVLGPTVDGQLVGGRRVRVAQHVGPVRRRDPVVPVGEAAGKGLDLAGPSPEHVDPLQESGVEARAVAGAHRRGGPGRLRAATRRARPGRSRSCAWAR